MSKPTITVEMIPGDHVLLRFPMAFATRKRPDGKLERRLGQINLSIETMEEAKTLRDALSAFITFHERFTPEAGRLIDLDEEIRRPAS